MNMYDIVDKYGLLTAIATFGSGVGIAISAIILKIRQKKNQNSFPVSLTKESQHVQS